MLKTTEATLKGHMDQERENVQSTKHESAQFEHEELLASNDSFPEKFKTKTSSCFYTIYDLAKETKTYTDLTGKFPNQSSKGNNYIFVAYNYDGNAILVEPISNRNADTIVLAWEKIHSRLQ